MCSSENDLYQTIFLRRSFLICEEDGSKGKSVCLHHVGKLSIEYCIIDGLATVLGLQPPGRWQSIAPLLVGRRGDVARFGGNCRLKKERTKGGVPLFAMQ